MLKLAPYFQNHMLLQAGATQKVWGNACPKSKISLCLQNCEMETLADEVGNWEILLPPLETSWQEELRVWTTDSDEICLRLAIGQLWLAGGQSNMEFHMRYERHLNEEMDNLPKHIYFYDVPKIAFPEAKEAFDFSQMARWRQASVEDIDWWSAVGYYFAKHLSRAIDSPIGVIGCNWGGTKIQSWMKLETIRELDPETFDAYQDWLQTQDTAAYWEKQRTSPLNNRGLPFEDAFGELVMPRTVKVEEFGAFLTHVGEEIKTYRSTLQPQTLPGSLYEHMVLQLKDMTIAGILWYQGESNDIEGKQYRYKSLLKGLIKDWREVFGEAVPVYVVQLPGYESWLDNKAIRYDIIRDCQEKAVKETDLTYLCSISDVGEQFDIHPKDKQTVGERLALLAQKHTYGYPIEADAPMLSQVTYNAGQVVLHFKHAEGGLVIRGERIEFLKLEVNGEERSFTERIDQDKLILKVLEVKGDPEWRISLGRSNWMALNLYNQAGIPAIPFDINLTF
ncbi:sialate O-acetylesterase [Streptococcus ovuberis]|uniref:Sialate O-acetylesterase n=1 Tax=Streptococcus ovuberis TaxID=1936207 RepID=A0A7X6S0M0_9STRE|nr:sialate O-acetylesterase [Streptococcus ovuberis]NKZ19907.1 sialate O-acetylesterase [Streptococcus ovuberis]